MWSFFYHMISFSTKKQYNVNGTCLFEYLVGRSLTRCDRLIHSVLKSSKVFFGFVGINVHMFEHINFRFHVHYISKFFVIFRISVHYMSTTFVILRSYLYYISIVLVTLKISPHMIMAFTIVFGIESYEHKKILL